MIDNPAAAITQSFVTRIVSSYVKKNHVAPTDISTVINTVHQSLIAVGKAAEPATPRKPAVSIGQSVRLNYVTCLECGRRGHMLRGHISAAHGLSAEQYRAKWGLAKHHPITAPAYSQQRSAFAKQIGLGKTTRGAPSAASPTR